jgi:hypothetical protein
MLRIVPVANEQTENPIGSVPRWMSVARRTRSRRRGGNTYRWTDAAGDREPDAETVRQVKAIIAGDVPAGAVNADHWKRQVSGPRG